MNLHINTLTLLEFDKLLGNFTISHGIENSLGIFKFPQGSGIYSRQKPEFLIQILTALGICVEIGNFEGQFIHQFSHIREIAPGNVNIAPEISPQQDPKVL